MSQDNHRDVESYLSFLITGVVCVLILVKFVQEMKKAVGFL